MNQKILRFSLFFCLPVFSVLYSGCGPIRTPDRMEYALKEHYGVDTLDLLDIIEEKEETGPVEWADRNDRAAALDAEGSVVEAEQELQDLIRTTPPSPVPYLNLSAIYAGYQSWDWVRNTLKKMAASPAISDEKLYGAALFLGQKGRYLERAIALEELYNYNRSPDRALEELASDAAGLGHRDLSITYLRRLLLYRPGDPAIHRNLAFLLYDRYMDRTSPGKSFEEDQTGGEPPQKQSGDGKNQEGLPPPFTEMKELVAHLVLSIASGSLDRQVCPVLAEGVSRLGSSGEDGYIRDLAVEVFQRGSRLLSDPGILSVTLHKATDSQDRLLILMGRASSPGRSFRKESIENLSEYSSPRKEDSTKLALETARLCPSAYRSTDLVALMGELELKMDFKKDLSYLRTYLPEPRTSVMEGFFQEAVLRADHYESNRDPWKELIRGWYGSYEPDLHGLSIAEEGIMSLE